MGALLLLRLYHSAIARRGATGGALQSQTERRVISYCCSNWVTTSMLSLDAGSKVTAEHALGFTIASGSQLGLSDRSKTEQVSVGFDRGDH